MKNARSSRKRPRTARQCEMRTASNVAASSIPCPALNASQTFTYEEQSCNPRYTTHKVEPAFVECALWDKLGRLHLTALVDTGATFSIVSREHAKQITRGRDQKVCHISLLFVAGLAREKGEVLK